MKLPELKNKFKNKYAIRIIAGALVVTLVGTGVSVYDVSAAKGNGAAKAAVEETVSEDTEEAEEADDEEALNDMLSSSLKVNEKEIGKEETVYIIADNTGKADSVIVSDHLINNDDKATIEDASTLTDIKNVKGDETFTQNGKKLVWQADGNDVYYQGTGKETTPVTQKLTYFLDGKEITPEELAGKSGKVTIRFDYTNNEKVEATVNGKKEEVCVPFVALSGMVLDDSFSDIEVTNGRVVADGNKSVVFGYALPGLKDSLKVNEKDFDGDISIPDYFEVSADVENFSLDMTMTVAMNATNFVSTERGDEESSLNDLMDELTDATSQLEDGSGALAEGVDTLKDNMGEFQNGVTTLKDGLWKYTDGAAALHDGIGTLKGGVDTLAGSVPMLVDGVNQLKAGSDKAAANAPDLAAGAKQVSDGAVNLKDGAAALAAGVGELNKNAPALATGAAQLAAGANELKAGVDTAVGMIGGMGATLETKKQGVQAQFEQTAGMTYAQAQGTIQALQQAQATLIQGMIYDIQAAQYLAVGGSPADADYQQLIGGVQTCYGGVAAALGGSITNANEAAVALSTVNAQIAALEKGMGQVDGATEALNGVGAVLSDPEVAKKLGDLSAGANALAENMGNLATGAAKLSDGIKLVNDNVPALTAGATALSGGAAQVAEGATALSDGIGQLNAGITQMHEKSGALGDGASQLKDGVNKLAQGSSELVSNNGALKDGVNKLSDGTNQIVDGVNQLSDGAHELADGIVTFNEEGINKIVNSYNGDIEPLMDRLQAVLDAGADYQSYTDIADGVNGSVKFIYKTAAVK